MKKLIAVAMMFTIALSTIFCTGSQDRGEQKNREPFYQWKIRLGRSNGNSH